MVWTPPHLFGGAYRQMTPYLFRGLENFGKSGGTSLPWGDLSILCDSWGLIYIYRDSFHFWLIYGNFDT